MKLKKQLIFLFLILLVFSCVEEISIQTETTFQSALIIEATITNEFKHQEIKLSRAYELGVEGPLFESNASVKVVDGNNIEYTFNETAAGTYKSNTQFAAQPNLTYELNIKTNNGKEYKSSQVFLTKNTAIDNLFFERGFNENDEEGVSVLIDAYDLANESKYYRFEYEETYKIIAPLYNTEDLIDLALEFIEENGTEVPLPQFDERFILVDRPIEEQVCYKTELSKNIILENTTELQEDRLDNFRVRFISRENYIMSYRYSILVNMYVQSFKAYTFYNTLKQFSQEESLLSETQPGFFEGNIFSVNNSSERVIGFFDVASIDSKRIYFNYSDFFPNEALPTYPFSCDALAPTIIPALPPPCKYTVLLTCYIDEEWKYVAENIDPNPDDDYFAGPYLLVQRACGDCTAIGNSESPIWWEE